MAVPTDFIEIPAQWVGRLASLTAMNLSAISSTRPITSYSYNKEPSDIRGLFRAMGKGETGFLWGLAGEYWDRPYTNAFM